MKQFEVAAAENWPEPAKSWSPWNQLEQDLGVVENIWNCAEEGLAHWVTSTYLTGDNLYGNSSGKLSLILKQT